MSDHDPLLVRLPAVLQDELGVSSADGSSRKSAGDTNRGSDLQN